MPPQRPVVFVSDNAPAVQATLLRRLDGLGIHAYLARDARPTSSAADYMGAFKCALVTLERPDGNDDPFGVASLLRLYQPALPVAFLHDKAAAPTIERARAIGPVFRKEDQLDHAIDWVNEKATGRKR